MDDVLQRLLRHDRVVVALALAVVISLSWVYILAGAGMGMDGFEMTRHTLMNMDMMQPAVWTPAYIILMFFMWWLMMLAMMLPSATPVILLASALNRRAQPNQNPFGPAAAFAAGYMLAWAAFSVIAVAVQWLLQKGGVLSGMLYLTTPQISSVLLIVAGVWQFTPWKQSCLRHCRGPVEFLTRHRRKGSYGAVVMGAHHGLYCLGCCWFLMALLFVGGVMNLFWIAGLAIYVWVEKVTVAGARFSRIMGAVLIVWGLYTGLSATLI
jgi:predicted metal-binding membrane protein